MKLERNMKYEVYCVFFIVHQFFRVLFSPALVRMLCMYAATVYSEETLPIKKIHILAVFGL